MIYLAADKHGFQAIKFVEEYVSSHNIEFVNLGVKNENEEMKLEDMLPPVKDKVLENSDNKAIISCGTGIGVEVGINKFSGIRACLATNAQTAEWSRIYDKCNVLCLIGWNTKQEEINKILDAWFAAQYDGNEGRLKMFEAFNKWH